MVLTGLVRICANIATSKQHVGESVKQTKVYLVCFSVPLVLNFCAVIIFIMTMDKSKSLLYTSVGCLLITGALWARTLYGYGILSGGLTVIDELKDVAEHELRNSAPAAAHPTDEQREG